MFELIGYFTTGWSNGQRFWHCGHDMLGSFLATKTIKGRLVRLFRKTLIFRSVDKVLSPSKGSKTNWFLQWLCWHHRSVLAHVWTTITVGDYNIHWDPSEDAQGCLCHKLHWCQVAKLISLCALNLHIPWDLNILPYTLIWMCITTTTAKNNILRTNQSNWSQLPGWWHLEECNLKTPYSGTQWSEDSPN